MPIYQGSLRDQRPACLADANESLLDDLATSLVPAPKPTRRAWDVLSEIEKVAGQIRQLFDDRNDLDPALAQIAGERFRQLAVELATVTK